MTCSNASPTGPRVNLSPDSPHRPVRPLDVRQLRRTLRARRRSLNPAQQAEASAALCAVVSGLLPFRRARRIGFYLAHGGEIDPAPLRLRAQQLGKGCFLPVLHPLGHNRLHFVAWREGEPLVHNRFGVPEPRLRHPVPAWSLDLILVPLVAFDAQGNRLGQGAGFYDRTLAFRRRGRRHPLLIGLAHAFQQVPRLPAAPWDVPLDGIASERRFLSARKPRHA